MVNQPDISTSRPRQAFEIEEPDPPRRVFHQILPAELLFIIADHLEYPSDANALSQTCHHLNAIANTRLSSYYIPRYSPCGLYRAITSANVLAARRLCTSPNFTQGGYRETYLESLETAAEPGFLEIVKIV